VRSPRSAFIAASIALALSAGLAGAPARAAGQPPTAAEVDAAIAKVKADPKLAAEKTVTSLEWKNASDPKPAKRHGDLGWLRWLGDFFKWFSGSAAFIVYAVLAALAAWLVVFIARIFMNNRGAAARARFSAPTHVQDLDIRPESLPPDVGASARALWDAGDRRAALALLYRGMLSRLAHVHGVPIKDSSTEGDTLRLAAGLLEARRLEYVAQVVRTWQRATYGGIEIDTPTVHALCAGFAAALDAAAGVAADAAPAGAAA
jgi:hypothetical protein